VLAAKVFLYKKIEAKRCHGSSRPGNNKVERL